MSCSCSTGGSRRITNQVVNHVRGKEYGIVTKGNRIYIGEYMSSVTRIFCSRLPNYDGERTKYVNLVWLFWIIVPTSQILLTCNALYKNYIDFKTLRIIPV